VIETKLIVIDLDKQFTFDLPAPPILAVMVRTGKTFSLLISGNPCGSKHVWHVICMNVGKPVRLEQAVDGQHETVDSVPEVF